MKTVIYENDFKLQHPSSCLLAGPSMSGKSSVCCEILSNLSKYYSQTFTKIILVYKNSQDLYDVLKDCGTPCVFLSSISEVDSEIVPNSIIFFDDQLLEIQQTYCDWLTDFFVRRIHHESVSCLLPVQNLYIKCMRTLHLQASYLCLFMNFRDKSVIWHLARQVEPKNSSFLQEAYNRACNKPYGYLFLDFTVNCPNPRLRVRNTILREDKTEIYIAK